jgi:large subunit ribosomal protein L15
MVSLKDLKPEEGSVKKRKRVGRGDASGTGGTAGRGHKGQNSRSGGSTRPGFEGGQTPLYRRIPKKRGFNNIFKKEYALLNISDLNKFEDGAEVDLSFLKDLGLVKKSVNLLKILGDGDVSKKISIVKVNKISKTAEAKLKKAAIKVEIIK